MHTNQNHGEHRSDGDWRLHSLFGFNLDSNFVFVNQLMPGKPPPDLWFECGQKPPVVVDWSQASCVYSSPAQIGADERSAYLYRIEECIVARFTQIADFYLWPDGVACHAPDTTHRSAVEIRLLGQILSLWLELRGILTLHGSAIVVGDRAVAFLSSNQGGKSTLAAALTKRGYPLLTDDVVSIEYSLGTFLGRPSYPAMRMWPEEAQHFLGHYADLELVHPMLSKRHISVGSGGFGTFCNTPRPLACIYLPERNGPADRRGDSQITPIPPRDAVLELVRHSFTPRAVEALGLQPTRLATFTRLVQGIPVRGLAYPSGFENLPSVLDAILQDLASLWHTCSPSI